MNESKVDKLDMLARWAAGQTLREIAAAYGVSHQRISQLLQKAGISPQARRTMTRRSRELESRKRALEHAGHMLERDVAIERLRALAELWGCTPSTLGQFAAMSGPYARGAEVRGHRPDHRTRLPFRYSLEGDAIAEQVDAAAAPWSARYLSALILQENREAAA